MFRKKTIEPTSPPEWMIVGLGNPGPQYARTRHNVGFDAIEALADTQKSKLNKSKHQAKYLLMSLEGTPVLLVCPLTFMNLSGRAVAAFAREFKLSPERIVVVADDLDLELGRVRMKPHGGHGGHNGHRSIIQLLGTNEYPRIKIGIGRGEGETVDHVLSGFTPSERVDVESAIRKTVEVCSVLARDGMERAITYANS